MTSLNFLLLKHRNRILIASALGVVSIGGYYYQFVQLPQELEREEAEKRKMYSAHDYLVQKASQGDPESNLILLVRQKAENSSNDARMLEKMTPTGGKVEEDEIEPFRFDVTRDGLQQSLAYLLEAKKAEEDYMTRDMRSASKEVQRSYIQRFKEIRQEKNEINAMMKRLQQRR